MKLTVLQENLKTAINLTSHFITNKAQLPILSSILIQANKSKLTLSATNLKKRKEKLRLMVKFLMK